jgi:nitric oxide reductase NorE protein
MKAAGTAAPRQTHVPGEEGLWVLILGALGCGAGFIVSKAFEWGYKIAHGITLNSNEFYGFYYMFTGFHLVHVLVGMGVLAYLLMRSRRPNRGTRYIAVMARASLA